MKVITNTAMMTVTRHDCTVATQTVSESESRCGDGRGLGAGSGSAVSTCGAGSTPVAGETDEDDSGANWLPVSFTLLWPVPRLPFAPRNARGRDGQHSVRRVSWWRRARWRKILFHRSLIGCGLLR